MTKSTLSHVAKSPYGCCRGRHAQRQPVLPPEAGEAAKDSRPPRALQRQPRAVREALSRLSAEGLVVGEAQRGFPVSPVSAEDWIDPTPARLDIEGLALRCSIAVAALTQHLSAATLNPHC